RAACSMNGKPVVTAYDAVGAFGELGIEYIGNGRDREVSIHCPLHDDQRPSCRVTTGTGAWYCDPCARGGAFPALLTALGVVGMKSGQMLSKYAVGRVELDSVDRLAGQVPVIDPDWVRLPGRLAPSPEQDQYRYHDQHGRHVATVHRDGKSFPVQHLRGWPGRSDGSDWVWAHPSWWPLYRLPSVRAAVAAGEVVYLCEGEKDADAMSSHVTATSCAGGAARRGLWHKPHSTDLGPLDGAYVVIIADRD